MGIALAVQQFLPLAHHAHIFVVQDEDLDRQVILHGRAHFLHAHLDAGFAGDINHQRARMRHLHAQRRGQAIAHGAKAAGCHPAVRFVEVEALRRPHLVLTHLGRHIDIVAVLGQLIQPVNRILRLDDGIGLAIVERLLGPPGVDLVPPGLDILGLVLLGLPETHHLAQRLGGVRDNGQVHAHDLVDLRGVDIQVDLLAVRRELLDQAGDTVVEARAQADHQVAIMHGMVGFPGAVHAHHAQPFGTRGREGAQAHQGRGHGETGQVHQLAQQLAGFRPGIDDAAAGIEDGALRRRHHLHRAHDGRQVGIGLGLVGAVMHRLRAHVSAGLELHVLGNVHDHGAGAAGGGDLECLMDHAGQIAHLLHQPVVLGAGPGNADRIAFLEGIGADQMRRHLAGQHHQRNGIHQRIGKTGHGIGGAGTRRDQHNAGLAGGAGIAFGGMHGALFVAHQHMGDAFHLEQRVIDGQHRAAGITEDVGDALILQRADHHLRTGHGGDHGIRRGLRRQSLRGIVLVHARNSRIRCCKR